MEKEIRMTEQLNGRKKVCRCLQQAQPEHLQSTYKGAYGSPHTIWQNTLNPYIQLGNCILFYPFTFAHIDWRPGLSLESWIWGSTEPECGVRQSQHLGPGLQPTLYFSSWPWFNPIMPWASYTCGHLDTPAYIFKLSTLRLPCCLLLWQGCLWGGHILDRGPGSPW